MNSPFPQFKGLRFKFVIAVTTVLVITLVSSALYLYQSQQKLLIDDLNNKAESLGHFIASISPKAVYSFDITTLDHFVEQISSDVDIQFALIRNAQGITMTTASPSGLTEQDIFSNPTSLMTSDRLSLYTFPIRDGEVLLGEIVIAVDNSRIINLNNSNLIQLLIIDLSIIIFLGTLIFIVFHINVLRPVKHLIDGANRLGEGTFYYQVPVVSNDELGVLANCFNQMADKINAEQLMLKQANNSLAEEVEFRKQIENQMELAASVFTYASEGILITDPDANIIDVNEAFTFITGYSREEVLGKNPRFMQSGKQDKKFYQSMWNSLNLYGHWNGEIWNRRKNGDIAPEILTISAVKDSDNNIQHFVALFSDITSQKEHQKQLEHIAHYDSLTGLPNRMLLADRLHQAISQANRRKWSVTVAYLDLDGFKEINDTYGHAKGDQLLIVIAQRMSDCLRDSDTLARLGGDEFVAVLIDSDGSESKQSLARLLAAAAQPVMIDNIQMQVSASIGVTTYPQDAEVDADQLVRQADQAMYRAKLEGKNKFSLFDPEEDQNLRGQHERIEELRQALEHAEFELYYQPKVNLRTGEIFGAEALIRWNHPTRGVLLPGLFLPLIEQHPLSIQLGEWVIKSALQQIHQWRDMGLDITVSVNVEAYHLQQGEFVQHLNKLLASHQQIDVSRLQLEVLETSTLDIVLVSQIMHQCLDLGIEFALDDFGTGYSSLTYLKHLPASVLKIDRSFIRDMMVDPEDLAIVEAVIGLARAFRREVIAEGVETMDLAEMLLMIGCESAQGFAIARPMPAHLFLKWTKGWTLPDSWRQIKNIQGKNQQILIALIEHRAWASSIENYLMGTSNKLPELDHSKCHVGRWLNSDGKKLYQQYPEFAVMVSLHTEIHDIAHHLLMQLNQGTVDIDAAQITHFTNVHIQLAGSMKRLLSSAQSHSIA